MFKQIKFFVALAVSFCFLFEQTGFAQAVSQPYMPPGYIDYVVKDKFRPLHLRSLAVDANSNDYDILMDKGDVRRISRTQMKETAQALMNYFQIGLTLPDQTFWVNLRPDAENEIIDPLLEQTDLGKVMLEADLQLKKDVARLTDPETPLGREYWEKVYARAEALFGADEMSIPTLTRPWIVPGEIIVREGSDNAYIYKATLKVMLEQDYIKDSHLYDFSDPRLKQLNEYSSELIRRMVIPRVTKLVNSSRSYAGLRQAYYSLILAQWFKRKFQNTPPAAVKNAFVSRIDSKDLEGLLSKAQWPKMSYYRQYRASFEQGEYAKEETLYTASGPVIRQYVSGGVNLGTAVLAPLPGQIAGSHAFQKSSEMPGIVPVKSKNGVITAQEQSAQPASEDQNRIQSTTEKLRSLARKINPLLPLSRVVAERILGDRVEQGTLKAAVASTTMSAAVLSIMSSTVFGAISGAMGTAGIVAGLGAALTSAIFALPLVVGVAGIAAVILYLARQSDNARIHALADFLELGLALFSVIAPVMGILSSLGGVSAADSSPDMDSNTQDDFSGPAVNAQSTAQAVPTSDAPVVSQSSTDAVDTTDAEVTTEAASTTGTDAGIDTAADTDADADSDSSADTATADTPQITNPPAQTEADGTVDLPITNAPQEDFWVEVTTNDGTVHYVPADAADVHNGSLEVDLSDYAGQTVEVRIADQAKATFSNKVEIKVLEKETGASAPVGQEVSAAQAVGSSQTTTVVSGQQGGSTTTTTDPGQQTIAPTNDGSNADMTPAWAALSGALGAVFGAAAKVIPARVKAFGADSPLKQGMLFVAGLGIATALSIALGSLWFGVVFAVAAAGVWGFITKNKAQTKTKNSGNVEKLPDDNKKEQLSPEQERERLLKRQKVTAAEELESLQNEKAKLEEERNKIKGGSVIKQFEQRKKLTDRIKEIEEEMTRLKRIINGGGADQSGLSEQEAQEIDQRLKEIDAELASSPKESQDNPLKESVQGEKENEQLEQERGLLLEEKDQTASERLHMLEQKKIELEKDRADIEGESIFEKAPEYRSSTEKIRAVEDEISRLKKVINGGGAEQSGLSEERSVEIDKRLAEIEAEINAGKREGIGEGTQNVEPVEPDNEQADSRAGLNADERLQALKDEKAELESEIKKINASQSGTIYERIHQVSQLTQKIKEIDIEIKALEKETTRTDVKAPKNVPNVEERSEVTNEASEKSAEEQTEKKPAETRSQAEEEVPEAANENKAGIVQRIWSSNWGKGTLIGAGLLGGLLFATSVGSIGVGAALLVGMAGAIGVAMLVGTFYAAVRALSFVRSKLPGSANKDAAEKTKGPSRLSRMTSWMRNHPYISVVSIGALWLLAGFTAAVVGVAALAVIGYATSRSGKEELEKAVPARSDAPRFEIGSDVGPTGHKINGGESNGRGDTREKIIVDWDADQNLQSLYKEVLAQLELSGVETELDGEQKGELISKVYALVAKSIKSNKSVASHSAGNEILVGDTIETGGVCRHMGIVSAAILEQLILSGALKGKVFYCRGPGHGWAVYENSAGEVYVFDVAQGYFGLIDGADWKDAGQVFYYRDYMPDGWTNRVKAADLYTTRPNNLGGGEIAKGSLAEETQAMDGWQLKERFPAVADATVIEKVQAAFESLSERLKGKNVVIADVEIHLFRAVVRGKEDYVLGFGRPGLIGLSDELVERMTDEELQQYIYHEFMEGVTEQGNHQELIADAESFGFDTGSLRSTLRSFINEKAGVGGIDFRALPILSQPGVAAGMPAVDARAWQIALEHSRTLDTDKEWKRIQAAVKKGQVPDCAGLKTYVAACSRKEHADKELEKVLACVAQILRIEEDEVLPTSKELQELLVILDSEKPVQAVQNILRQADNQIKEPAVRS